jgi:hypothetical protein
MTSRHNSSLNSWVKRGRVTDMLFSHSVALAFQEGPLSKKTVAVKT